VRPDTLVAIYAAIIGTSAFLLNLKAWFESGVKLNLRVVPDAMVLGGDEVDEKDLTILYVTNRGDADTTITSMVLLEIGSWWRLTLFKVTSSTSWLSWKVLPDKSYAIMHPQLKGYPPNLPSTLEPARRWTGAVRPRIDIIPDIQTGNFYVGVYASNRDRPYLIRIPRRHDKLPEGTEELS
jgi:hypothetical protein